MPAPQTIEELYTLLRDILPSDRPPLLLVEEEGQKPPSRIKITARDQDLWPGLGGSAYYPAGRAEGYREAVIWIGRWKNAGVGTGIQRVEKTSDELWVDLVHEYSHHADCALRGVDNAGGHDKPWQSLQELLTVQLLQRSAINADMVQLLASDREISGGWDLGGLVQAG